MAATTKAPDSEVALDTLQRTRLLNALHEFIDNLERHRRRARTAGKDEVADSIGQRLDTLYAVVEAVQDAEKDGDDHVVRLEVPDDRTEQMRLDLAKLYSAVAPVSAPRAMKQAQGEPLASVVKMLAGWGDRA